MRQAKKKDRQDMRTIRSTHMKCVFFFFQSFNLTLNLFCSLNFVTSLTINILRNKKIIINHVLYIVLRGFIMIFYKFERKTATTIVENINALFYLNNVLSYQLL